MALINRFFAFTPAELLDELRRLGIEPGDVIMAHTSFDQFAGFQGGIAEAIEVLKAAVGEEGTLLLPTLPFSGSALEYVRTGQLTDIARTPSRMGFITEIFRRLPGVARSIHPTHPVAAWGRNATEVVADHNLASTPCGRGTPFHSLLKHDGKILLAGVDVRTMTFFHCVEELIEPEMPFSPFTEEWFELETRGADGKIYKTSTRLFAPAISSKRDVRLMSDWLRQRGLWRHGRVGRLDLTVLRAVDVLETARAMAREGKYCYSVG